MSVMSPGLRPFIVYPNDSLNVRQNSDSTRSSPRAGVLDTQFFIEVKNLFFRTLEALQSVPNRIASLFECWRVDSEDMGESGSAPTVTVPNQGITSSTQTPAAALLDSAGEEVIDFTKLEVRDFPDSKIPFRDDIHKDEPVLLDYKNCYVPHCTPEPLLMENGFELPPAGDFFEDVALEVVISEQDRIIPANDFKDSSSSNRSSPFLKQKLLNPSARNRGRVL